MATESRMQVRYGLTEAHRATLTQLEKAATLTAYDVGVMAALARHATGDDLKRVEVLRERAKEPPK